MEDDAVAHDYQNTDSETPKIKIVQNMNNERINYGEVNNFEWSEDLPVLKNQIPDYTDNGRIYDIIYMGDRYVKMFKQGSRLYIID